MVHDETNMGEWKVDLYNLERTVTRYLGSAYKIKRP